MVEVSFVLEWVAIVFLVLLSGLFSGLNLGLMGLDQTDLEVVINGGDEPESSYASKIKPLRQKGNWLLCTLLLGNVAVNTALSILLAQKADALIGFLVSTIVIVVFGEIIPQALCSRYALWIGSRTVNIVWLLMAIISFAAYPIAMILDAILGEELQNIYSTRELKQLINIHAKHAATEINKGTASIMKGALDLQEAKIRDVMTKIEDVFWLPKDAKLTFDVLTQIFKSGHSRIPIMKKSDFNGDLSIVGMLFAKDLILLDPEDEISVQHVMNAFKSKKPLFLSDETTLDQCLKIFVHSRQHLCMVSQEPTKVIVDVDVKDENENLSEDVSQFDQYLRKLNGNKNDDDIADPKTIGIITLEDVIELALQTELVDEHDVFVDINSHRQTNRLERIDWSVLKLFDHRHAHYSSLPPQELQAVFHFLSQSCKPFLPKHRKCSESSIKNLLNISSVIKVESQQSMSCSTKRSGHKLMRDPYKSIENNGLLIAERDKKTEYFTLILDGKCEVYAGRQGFRSKISRWTFLCPEALKSSSYLVKEVEECVLSGKPMLDHVPDFTCKVIEDARVLRIKLSDFKACIEGKFESFLSAEHKQSENGNGAPSNSNANTTDIESSDPGALNKQQNALRYSNMTSPDNRYKKK